jgi:catalase
MEKTSSGPGPYVLIALIVAVVAAAFAYVAGWLTPNRLTPVRIVDSIAPASGPSIGFRRNHAKGVCFTGTFEANGAGASLSRAQMMMPGSYPVTGRFNLATTNPNAIDGMERVRGLSLRVVTPGGQEWRSAMIDAPFFPVATPQAFFDLQQAAHAKGDPEAMKRFAAAHPELGAFGAWAGSAPRNGSFAEGTFNSLNSFVFTSASGATSVVRWSFVPAEPAVAVPGDELAKRDPNFLSSDITERVGKAPQRWTMSVSVANAGDPTADPSKAWPADRRRIDVGTLRVQAIEPEPDGPCRDINFDPTVLPEGMGVSDDPFPAARSAAYAVSFDRRTAETYPQPASGSKP